MFSILIASMFVMIFLGSNIPKKGEELKVKANELLDLAKEKGVCFFYETTVMAGTPVFNMADNCLQYCKIDKVEGIFNATTNYILKEMGKGIPYDEIIKAGRAVYARKWELETAVDAAETPEAVKAIHW